MEIRSIGINYTYRQIHSDSVKCVYDFISTSACCVGAATTFCALVVLKSILF